MNTVQVSFIIPVYNAERYLARCLDSVLNQTIDNIEVICINDCSPDGSPAILRDYAAKDSRIRLIDFKENMGPGAARNTGIQAVRGEYIRMVDADDYIPLESTAALLHAAKQYNSSYVCGGYWYCDIDGNMLRKGWNYPDSLVVNSSIQSDLRLWRLDQHWAFLYKTDALLASGARYDESMLNGQDSAFLVELMPSLEKVTFIPETVYFYREHPASTMRRKRGKDFYLNVIKLYSRTYERLESIGVREPADYILYLAVRNYLPQNILSTMADNLELDDALEILSVLRNLLLEYNFKELCFTPQYTWQKNHIMPWQVKYFILLLQDGYLEEAYKLISDYARQEREIQEMQRKINDYRNELEGVYDSTSWKITEPVRKLGTLLIRKNRSFQWLLTLV